MLPCDCFISAVLHVDASSRKRSRQSEKVGRILTVNNNCSWNFIVLDSTLFHEIKKEKIQMLLAAFSESNFSYYYGR